MTPELTLLFERIQNDINALTLSHQYLDSDSLLSRQALIDGVIEEQIQSLPDLQRLRIKNEFYGNGPLDLLLDDDSVSEIIINRHNQIWFEQKGKLHRFEDAFLSPLSFRNFTHRWLDSVRSTLDMDQPFCDSKLENCRLSFVDSCISGDETALCIRKHPKMAWRLDDLVSANWCSKTDAEILTALVKHRKNLLVIGPTGSGKTSVMNSLLHITEASERSILIEDTQELSIPNGLGLRLLTKSATHAGNSEVDQTQLVRRALRLRPDRLIMGEIRGGEAKDFLMALSTGHMGSMGTLHSQDPHQALLRLEMLIQMGAPQWKNESIRRLISLSLDYLIVTARAGDGQRRLSGVYQIHSLEDTGFLIEQIHSVSDV